ncbi:MAG: acyltransferase [Frankiales bacterium]|nr:acyltransferase [Frankiales bacterium]
MAAGRPREPLNACYLLAAGVLKPLALLTTRRTWQGTEHVPATGGVIVAANHLSIVDPIVVGDFLLFGAGLVPRFMAKRHLFEGGGVIARVMRGAGQIPVDRGAATAAQSLEAAVGALDAGRCVMIYPEGTTTRDPDWWPMVPRTGVARLALLSGAPVLPLAQWGAQRIYRRGERRVHLLPPKRVQLRMGAPVDLGAYAGRPLDGDVLRDATAAVMDAVTTQLELIRGEKRPARVHDPRRHEADSGPGADETRRTA